MKIGIKGLMKGIMHAVVSAIIYVIVPYYIIQFTQQYFAGIAIDTAILQWIGIIGGAIVVVAFFVGFLQPKTIEHAGAGLAQAALIAMYIYYVVGGGYKGTFGIFSVSFGPANIVLDIGMILLLSLLIVLLSSLGYVVELVQTIRLRGKTVPAEAAAAAT